MPASASRETTTQELLQATLRDETLKFVEFPAVLPLRLPRFSKKERADCIIQPSLEITLQCAGVKKCYRLTALQCIGTSHWVTYNIAWPAIYQGQADANKLYFYFFDSMTDRINEQCVPGIRRADIAAIWVKGNSLTSDVRRILQDASLAYYVPVN